MFRRSQEEERLSERNKNEVKKGQTSEVIKLFYHNCL